MENTTKPTKPTKSAKLDEQKIEDIVREVIMKMAQEHDSEFVLKTTSSNLGSPKLDGDVGYDLPAIEEVVIPAHGFAKVKTEIKVELPEGFWGLITSRSSANNSGQIICLPGVIDNGFRGELLAFVHNVSDDKYTVTIGKAVVQLVLFPMVVPPVEVVNDLGTSIRGIAGFGSTDTVGE